MIGEVKILIVDDEIELSILTAKRIRSAGYTVECYFQGESAVDTIRRNKPSLVLLDIKLPKVSGTDIYQRVKQDDELKDIPVVFISAMHKEQDYCLNVLGAQGFIPKPFDSQALLETIKKTLSMRH